MCRFNTLDTLPPGSLPHWVPGTPCHWWLRLERGWCEAGAAPLVVSHLTLLTVQRRPGRDCRAGLKLAAAGPGQLIRSVLSDTTTRYSYNCVVELSAGTETNPADIRHGHVTDSQTFRTTKYDHYDPPTPVFLWLAAGRGRLCNVEYNECRKSQLAVEHGSGRRSAAGLELTV